MALIAYKNLFPRDFSDLQLNRGFVYALFDRKPMFIKSEQEKLQKLIDDKKSEIEISDNEHLNSIKDLDEISYAKNEKARRSGYYSKEHADNQEWQQKELPRRKKAIEDKKSDKRKALEQDVAELQHKMQVLVSLPLREIITRDNIDSIFCLTTTNEIGDVRTYEEIKGSISSDKDKRYYPCGRQRSMACYDGSGCYYFFREECNGVLLERTQT